MASETDRLTQETYADILADGRLVSIIHRESLGYSPLLDHEDFIDRVLVLPLVGPFYSKRATYGAEITSPGYRQGSEYTSKSGYAGYTHEDYAYMILGLTTDQVWYPGPNDLIEDTPNDSAKWIIKNVRLISPAGKPIVAVMEVER